MNLNNNSVVHTDAWEGGKDPSEALVQQQPVARRFAKAHRQTRGKEKAKSGVALLRDVC